MLRTTSERARRLFDIAVCNLADALDPLSGQPAVGEGFESRRQLVYSLTAPLGSLAL